MDCLTCIQIDTCTSLCGDAEEYINQDRVVFTREYTFWEWIAVKYYGWKKCVGCGRSYPKSEMRKKECTWYCENCRKKLC